MLLRPILDYGASEPLYNPLNNISQSELMEKFNLAFYEAQAVSKADIVETFENLQNNEKHPKQIMFEDDGINNDDCLIDYLISDDSTKTCDINFDFNDFVEDFDQNVRDSFSDSTTVVDFDTETFTTENSKNYDDVTEPKKQFSNFFVPPPIWSNNMEKHTEYLSNKNGFYDIDVCEALSNGSLDMGEWSSEVQDLDVPDNEYSTSLPPVGTITKNNFDFNFYVRNVPCDDMGYFKHDSDNKSEFGHLIGLTTETKQVERSENNYEKEEIGHILEQNHMVLCQSDALLNDDPLLSSSNTFYITSLDTEEIDSTDQDETMLINNYQCKWENCYEKCLSQISLVNHIEKCHVEIKRGDEFTCFWEQCPRKTKPFNARYKLLIHMRVHSGEKPNKCPFKGCNKAFSRLENLKIHQRSHTGERPYLCQFNGCSKCFSNSSDRAKHQRTHFDTKPYACQVLGCFKKYTDPSSLRKHVKNHSPEEQLQIKKKSQDESTFSNITVKKFLDPSRQKAIKAESRYNAKLDHTYSNTFHKPTDITGYISANVKQDLKSKIEKNKIRKMF